MPHISSGGGQAASAPLDISARGQLASDLTNTWLIISGCMVFFMQGGFALLEAGGIRRKNTNNIMLKNVVNTCLAAVCWFLVGQALSTGACGATNRNPVIGTQHFALSNEHTAQSPLALIAWFFSFVFAAVSVTIPSGALAERCQLRAYVIYTILQSSFTYPVVVHWVWSQAGWLSPFRINCTTGDLDLTFPGSVGFIDFAGSGNVHMTGGGAALVGAYLLGPRLGRFGPGRQIFHMESSSSSNKVLGVMILWFGWFFFNAGSTGCVYGCAETSALITVNTTLSAAAGGLTSLVLETLRGAPGDVMPILNGILAGLVGITSACAVVQPYSALCIGIISGAVLVTSSILLKRLRIDDPLDSSAVHFFCGVWGVLCPGFFAVASLQNAAYGTDRPGNSFAGVFYGGSGDQLGIQILGATAISVWTLGINFVLFKVLQTLAWLRVSKEVEEEGLDFSQSIGTGTAMLPGSHSIKKLGVPCGCL